MRQKLSADDYAKVDWHMAKFCQGEIERHAARYVKALDEGRTFNAWLIWVHIKGWQKRSDIYTRRAILIDMGKRHG